MQTYYNSKKQAVIDINSEACDFETWNNCFDQYSCCKHPNGFLIFLNPNELKLSDEYKLDDPYTVIENLNSDFHQRRINCTIDLINKTTQKLKILDLGCGQGHLTNRIKKNHPNYDISGLDYSITAIDYANSKFKGIDFIVANAYNPPFIDEYFDVVICNNLWEHVPDPLILLNSINRILKPNGSLIISTPSRYRLTNFLRACLVKKIVFMSDHHITEYSVGQIIEQLKYSNLQISKIYSPLIKESKLFLRIIKLFLSLTLKVLNSHHILEATVFYCAIKMPKQK